ncbi:MAG: glycosyltransferase involved in cell wall biosynthesis [Arenicella sp.]
MTKKSPNVSVILPVFNGERFIHEALTSLSEQNFPGLELILVDDGSTDSTAEIAKRFFTQHHGIEFKYHYQKQCGVASARNLGLKEASNELIAFLDVDDLWPLGKLEAHLKRFTENPELLAVLGHTHFVKIDFPSEQHSSITRCPQMLLGAGLYKRLLFEKIGSFDTSLLHGEDWDWFLRCREACVAIKVFSDDSLVYRRHGSNLSLQKDQSQRDFLRLLKQSLDRRRATENINSDELRKSVNGMKPWSDILN